MAYGDESYDDYSTLDEESAPSVADLEASLFASSDEDFGLYNKAKSETDAIRGQLAIEDEQSAENERLFQNRAALNPIQRPAYKSSMSRLSGMPSGEDLPESMRQPVRSYDMLTGNDRRSIRNIQLAAQLGVSDPQMLAQLTRGNRMNPQLARLIAMRSEANFSAQKEMFKQQQQNDRQQRSQDMQRELADMRNQEWYNRLDASGKEKAEADLHKHQLSINLQQEQAASDMQKKLDNAPVMIWSNLQKGVLQGNLVPDSQNAMAEFKSVNDGLSDAQIKYNNGEITAKDYRYATGELLKRGLSLQNQFREAPATEEIAPGVMVKKNASEKEKAEALSNHRQVMSTALDSWKSANKDYKDEVSSIKDEYKQESNNIRASLKTAMPKEAEELNKRLLEIPKEQQSRIDAAAESYNQAMQMGQEMYNGYPVIKGIFRPRIVAKPAAQQQQATPQPPPEQAFKQPTADQYEVGKVYTSKSGKQVKYLGNNKWGAAQ